MKRLVALLLAVLLPLQFAWGAAAASCQHETAAQGATHFGHHQHVHAADSGHADKAVAQLAIDQDCGFCNVATTAVVPQFATPAPFQPLHRLARGADPGELPSALQRAPERPQWPRLV